MTHVLVVGKGPPDRGGISAYLQMLLRSDVQHQFDVRFLHLAGADTSPAGRLTVRNVRRVMRDVLSVWSAAIGQDIVHLHSAMVPHLTLLRLGLLTLAARLRAKHVLVPAHSGAVEGWLRASRWRRLIARVCLRPATSVVTVDRGSMEQLGRVVGWRPLVFIENGVNVSAFGLARFSTKPRVLYAGLLAQRKGVVALIEASRLLDERGVQHEVVIVGGTPDEGVEAEAIVRRAAEGSRVRLAGPQPHEQMADWYRSADVFCLPSWYEAMPLAVLEAMASGLPVVATAVGDVGRAVHDGVTGLLVQPRDVQALADALQLVVGDIKLRQRFGAAGRRRAEEHFNAEATFGAVAALYRELSEDVR